MNYRQRGVQVAAWRISQAGSPPSWVTRLFREGVLSWARAELRVTLPTGELYATEGDWLLRTSTGALSLSDEASFREQYEALGS